MIDGAVDGGDVHLETDAMEDESIVADSILGERLEQALKRINPATGKPWKQVDVVRAMAELNPPVEMTVSYFHDLLAGHRRNPSAKYLEAFAKVFDVDLSFFFKKSRQEQLGNPVEPDAVCDLNAYEFLATYQTLSSEDKVFVISVIERLANGR